MKKIKVWMLVCSGICLLNFSNVSAMKETSSIFNEVNEETKLLGADSSKKTTYESIAVSDISKKNNNLNEDILNYGKKTNKVLNDDYIKDNNGNTDCDNNCNTYGNNLGYSYITEDDESDFFDLEDTDGDIKDFKCKDDYFDAGYETREDYFRRQKDQVSKLKKRNCFDYFKDFKDFFCSRLSYIFDIDDFFEKFNEDKDYTDKLKRYDEQNMCSTDCDDDFCSENESFNNFKNIDKLPQCGNFDKASYFLDKCKRWANLKDFFDLKGQADVFSDIFLYKDGTYGLVFYINFGKRISRFTTRLDGLSEKAKITFYRSEDDLKNNRNPLEKTAYLIKNKHIHHTYVGYYFKFNLSDLAKLVDEKDRNKNKQLYFKLNFDDKFEDYFIVKKNNNSSSDNDNSKKNVKVENNITKNENVKGFEKDKLQIQRVKNFGFKREYPNELEAKKIKKESRLEVIHTSNDEEIVVVSSKKNQDFTGRFQVNYNELKTEVLNSYLKFYNNSGFGGLKSKGKKLNPKCKFNEESKNFLLNEGFSEEEIDYLIKSIENDVKFNFNQPNSLVSKNLDYSSVMEITDSNAYVDKNQLNFPKSFFDVTVANVEKRNDIKNDNVQIKPVLGHIQRIFKSTAFIKKTENLNIK